MAGRVKEVITTCTRDCPDACGIVAQVAEGRVQKLRGAADHPVTRGFLCPKMYKYPDYLYHRERLTTPLLKQGASFTPISYKKAYEIAAAEIEKVVQKYGPKAILFNQSAGSMGIMRTLNLRFFNLLGGVTRNAGGLCTDNALRGQWQDFGQSKLSNSPLDLKNSQTIIFWGRNAADTHPHLFYQAQLAQKNGALLVAVDPRRSRTAAMSDMHVAVRPGGDWALALLLIQGVMDSGRIDQGFLKDAPGARRKFRDFVYSYSHRELINAVGIPAETLFALTEMLTKRGPVAIYPGVGMTYWQNGVEIIRLIDALGGVLGTLGAKGGGVNLCFNGWGCFDQSLTLAGNVQERYLFEPSLGREMVALEDPPLKLAWVAGANPLTQNPNSTLVKKAFSALDFIIVNELFLTDTARAADLIFPVSSFLERRDATGSWGHNYLGPVNPVVESAIPSDLVIFQETACHLGFGADMAGDAEDWLEKFLAPLKPQGISYTELKEGWLKNPLLPDIPALNNHSFNVITSLPRGEEPLDTGEFYLLTPKVRNQTHSQKLPPKEDSPGSLFLSSRQAAAAGIKDGGGVVVSSAQGTLTMKAFVRDGIGEDTVLAPMGGWHSEGQGVNTLTCDATTEAGGMTVNGTRVTVTPLPEG